MFGRRPIVGVTLFLVVLLTVGCSLIDDASSADDPSPPPATAGTGTIIISVQTEPADRVGSFTVTGVPSGTLTVDTTLVVSDLEPGTYTTTEVNPAPDFDVTAVACDDGDSAAASSGDPQTRTAVINLDADETVTCTFTNTQRATAVVVAETEPEAAGGQFGFTGVPSGTIPTDGTLVAALLPPGTYTTTEIDPAPQFDLVSVRCDDGDSVTVSGGDPTTRSANFQLDPGEMVTCVFVNARRGTAVVAFEVDAETATEPLLYTGVPSGTIPSGGTLVVTDLPPGTYTTTEAEPPEIYDLVEVRCDDGGAGLASSGDPATRSAIYNIDPGETVTCTFLHDYVAQPVDGGQSTGLGGADPETGEASGAPEDGRNPFDDPDGDLSNFPLPDPLPADAGSATVPRAGTWTAYNLQGQMDCGAMGLGIPASPPENGVMEVLDGGQTVVGTGLQEEATASVTMTADPAIAGRYTGTFDGTQEGVAITIDNFWQVVTSEYIVGYLTSSFTAEGVSCSIYRPYELRYAGAN